MGDSGAGVLLQGLYDNPRLEALILRNCALTDKAGRSIASVVRWHGVALDSAHWQTDLRRYPPPAGAPPPSPRDGVPVGGLVWLDLSGNALTNSTATSLCNALAHETRLCGLDLSGNALTLSAGISLHEVMGAMARSLQFVDLRRSAEAELGVIMRGADGQLRHAPRGPALAALIEGTAQAWEARACALLRFAVAPPSFAVCTCSGAFVCVPALWLGAPPCNIGLLCSGGLTLSAPSTQHKTQQCRTSSAFSPSGRGTRSGSGAPAPSPCSIRTTRCWRRARHARHACMHDIQ